MTSTRPGDGRAPDGRGQDERIDRIIVLAATAAAVLFLAVIVTSSLVGGETRSLIGAVPPSLVAAVGVFMLARKRPNALMHLGVGMAGLVFVVSVDGSPLPGDPVVGLLSLAIVGSVLVNRRVVVYLIVSASMIGYAGYAWQPGDTPIESRLVDAALSVILFLITAVLLAWIKAQSNRRRLQLERLITAKDAFVAAVSHELRTPLTTIVGLSLELDDRLDDFTREEVSDLMRLITQESQDVAHIVEDLLVVGQDGVGDLQLDQRPIELIEDLEKVASSLDVALESVAEGEVRVWVDPGRTRQVIRNLIINAKRYGGSLVRIVVRRTRNNAIVEVRDSGDPIPLEERELMFLPYHRAVAASGTPGSMGLGLTVSRRLARLMDGDLTYRHDGNESIFSVVLPLDRTALGATQASAA